MFLPERVLAFAEMKDKIMDTLILEMALFAHALISSEAGHENALAQLKDDIARIKQGERI